MATSGISVPLPSEHAEQVAQLAQLPRELTDAREDQWLTVAAQALVLALPGVSYVRIVALAETLAVRDVVELCCDPACMPDLEQLTVSSMSAQHAAVLEGKAISVSSSRCADYDDVRLLHELCGLESFAAVPVLLGGAVHGVMLVASQDPDCLSARNLTLLQSAASMLAPYAALLAVREQVQASKQVLQLMMPPRVVAAVAERIGWGNGPLGLQPM